MEGRRVSTDSSRSRRYLQWRGTCIHSIDTPRWVQKRRRRDPDDPDAGEFAYTEPRRAMVVAINTKFSLIAIGTYGYASSRLSLRTNKPYLYDVVEPWSSRISPPRRAHLQKYKYYKYPACMRDAGLVLYIPWSGALMVMSWPLVGRRGGQFGASAVGAWHGASAWSTKLTKRGESYLIRFFSVHNEFHISSKVPGRFHVRGDRSGSCFTTISPKPVCIYHNY